MSSKKRTPERALDRVEHMLDRIGRIRAYVQGYTFERFASDLRTFDAVVYSIQIIGEAAPYLLDGLDERHPGIPWRNIKSMRHVLVHGYDQIDPLTVWEVATEDLGALETALVAERQWLTILLTPSP